MALKIGPCPKCGSTTFIATAHVTQTWLVDEDGDFIEAKSDCDEVTHAPMPRICSHAPSAAKKWPQSTYKKRFHENFLKTICSYHRQNIRVG